MAVIGYLRHELNQEMTSTIKKNNKTTLQLEYRVGCSGWSYSSWQGPFYPSNIENSGWLKYCSRVFDYVEIDSTFYRIPSVVMVHNWAKRTPTNFRFTAKFSGAITLSKYGKYTEILPEELADNNDIGDELNGSSSSLAEILDEDARSVQKLLEKCKINISFVSPVYEFN
jgi:uncharacterized protein YecE (DUF72 family)